MTSDSLPKVTFGIIVFNGEPFTHYCLRSLYTFAYEIIVVEGATVSASAIATPDGHSTDDTLETLRRFKDEEDREDKVQIVVRDGFWSEKNEQSQAYAERATGDYLWQVDIDEFYKVKDIQCILKMLQKDPDITSVSFKQITFWGGFNYVTDGWYLRRGAEIYHRLFKWGPGYCYATHRPPTVYDPQGVNLRELKGINGYQLAQQEIFLYHYSLVFPKQVLDKCIYYSQTDWASHATEAMKWAYNNFFILKDPFRVHNVYQYLSWLERYHGTHPTEIMHMWEDIKEGRITIDIRPNEDVEKLLSSWRYILKRGMMKQRNNIDPFYRRARRFASIIKRKFFS
jgi:glycosyltransferase involved in cell wall biosynthesis